MQKIKQLIKSWGWTNIILVSLLSGYLSYVFILALANTICDCIQESKMTDNSLFDGVNYKPLKKRKQKSKTKQSVLWTVYHTILAIELLIIIIIEGVELYHGF